MRLPDKIADIQRKMARLQRESNPLRDELDLIKAKYLVEVGEEKSGTKPKYPDRETRMAAVTIKMIKDPRAMELKERVARYDEQIRDLEIEQDRLMLSIADTDEEDDANHQVE